MASLSSFPSLSHPHLVLAWVGCSLASSCPLVTFWGTHQPWVFSVRLVRCAAGLVKFHQNPHDSLISTHQHTPSHTHIPPTHPTPKHTVPCPTHTYSSSPTSSSFFQECMRSVCGASRFFKIAASLKDGMVRPRCCRAPLTYNRPTQHRKTHNIRG